MRFALSLPVAAAVLWSWPALAHPHDGPAPAGEAKDATPCGGDCDKDCEKRHHHAEGGEKHDGKDCDKDCDCHGGEHSGAAGSAGNPLSDMGGTDAEFANTEFDCDEGDAMCAEVRDRKGHMPPWMRGLAGRALGRTQIEPHALVQTQFTGMAGEQASIDHGDRAEKPGFALRRARFGTSGRWGKRVEFAAYADLAGSSSLLSEAWASIDLWPNATLMAGAHRTPFSRSSMVSSAHQALAERPHAVYAMAPSRQVGVTLSGKYPKMFGIAWYLGAYNGFERDVNLYAGFKEFAGLTGNRFGGIAAVARLQIEPLGDMGPEVYDATGGSLRASVGASYYTSNGSTTTMNGHGLDIHAKVHGFHALVELMADSADPKDKPTEKATINAAVSHRAMLAEVGYSKWRYNVAARFQAIDPDTSVADEHDEQIFSGALGYQLRGDRVRLQLQFDHRVEAKGPGLKNDVAFVQLQLFL